MKYLGYVFLLLGRLVLFPVYFLSGLVPRRPDLWVFGSWGGRRFADNAAAFFLYCQTTVSERIELVWLSRNRKIVEHLRSRGYKAHWLWSPAGIVAALRAGLHIFDCFPKDTNFWLSRGSAKVNLWSGVPLKVFERDIDNPANRYYKLFHGNILERALFSLMMPWHVVKPDVIIAMSDETALITERAFALPKTQVAITGFPRNDALLDPSILTARDAEKVPKTFRDAVLSDSKVFLYLPTFRDTGGWSIDFDWEALNAELSELNAKLFYKTHPVDSGKYTANFPNIIQLPQTTEVYSLLPGIDALISDYSSVIFDFMLTGKPIIYYTPDLADFESGCRSFNFRPQEVAVGPVCMSFDELLNALRQIVAGAPSIFSANRDEVMGRLHKFSDSRSNERVLALIRERYYSGAIREPSPDLAVQHAADRSDFSTAKRVD